MILPTHTYQRTVLKMLGSLQKLGNRFCDEDQPYFLDALHQIERFLINSKVFEDMVGFEVAVLATQVEQEKLIAALQAKLDDLTGQMDKEKTGEYNDYKFSN